MATHGKVGLFSFSPSVANFHVSLATASALVCGSLELWLPSATHLHLLPVLPGAVAGIFIAYFRTIFIRIPLLLTATAAAASAAWLITSSPQREPGSPVIITEHSEPVQCSQFDLLRQPCNFFKRCQSEKKEETVPDSQDKKEN